MIIDQIKAKIVHSMKNGEVVAKNVLRLVLGECQQKNLFDDDNVVKVIKKLIQSNSETINLLIDKNDLRVPVLVQENHLLGTLIPQTMAWWEIEQFFDREGVTKLIKDEQMEGKAVGIAMKACKSHNLRVEGSVVKQCVLKLRGQ